MHCRIHASPVEAVSLQISEAAGAMCAVESMRHPWKQFRCRFLRPQGLLALSNPCVTGGRSFVDDFIVDDFYAHMGCLRYRIQASPVEAVSLKISEAAGVVWAVESMGHSWKQFR